MKSLVIFVILLIISMPISFAKEVDIPELFEVEKQVVSETVGKDVYFYAGSILIAVDDEYKYQDRLGSDSNSKSLPFGQPLNIDERLSFTGKEFDEDLYYFNARYYDSDLGKFTSVDLVKVNHAYSYVANNPMNNVDPSGMDGRRLDIDIPDNLPPVQFHSALSDPDGGTYFDPMNYGGGGYMSAYAYAGMGSMGVIGIAYGGYLALPYLASLGTTAAAYPLESAIVAGMAANAIDPNPAADHLAGIPGDEVGNFIGAGVRKTFSVLRGRGAIAMDSSGTAVKFMEAVNSGLRNVFRSGADDGTNVLIHGDEFGDFMRMADDGAAIPTSIGDAASAVARELDPGETCVNLVACYGDRGKIQRFTNALSDAMGHPMTVRADVSGKALRVGSEMPFVRRLDYGTTNVMVDPWHSIPRFGANRVPAEVFSFTPTR
jgi:RHS repeat-associated protein